MIYYSQDPTLDRKTVTTYDGKTEYRKNCRKIKDQYYVIDKSVFEIDGVWYRINSGLIEYDHETKKYRVIKESNMIKGIVKFENGKPVTGYFTPNPYKNCKVSWSNDEGYLPCISEELLIGNNYGEDFSTSIWHSLKRVSVKELQTPRNAVDNTQKGYNIEDNAQEFEDKIKLYNQFNTELTKDVRQYGRMLRDTTFGFEIECSKGFLPEHIQNQTGVIICRDGSLNDENGKPGPEFVTIPMSGAKGLQTISNIGKELSKRTSLDLKCSLHIHLGNLPTTRMYLVSLYRLAYKLQNDIFQMFPFYKTNPEGVKKKNYNQKLPSLDIMSIPSTICKDNFDQYINDSYNALFTWLSEGYRPDVNINRKRKIHPVGQKWNRHARYYWINFMNTIFSNRNTVEFRLHTPTTNVQKMINWLFICNAIVRYANLNSSKILLNKTKITLNDVLSYYDIFGERGKFLSAYLKAYVDERKRMILSDIKNGDKISEWDVKNDKNYVFTFGNTNYLF